MSTKGAGRGPYQPPFLAFDCSGRWFAAAVVGQKGTLCDAFEALTQNAGEQLLVWLEAVLAQAGLKFQDLGGIAVGVGPGSFTGVRLAVAAARGLALGLGVEARGVSSFALMRALPSLAEKGVEQGTKSEANAAELVTLAAPQGQLVGQIWEAGKPSLPPFLFDPANPAQWPFTGKRLQRIRGVGAEGVAAALGLSAAPDTLERALPERLALAAPVARPGRPTPLYVRPADAAPPAEAPPPLIDAAPC